MGLLAFNPDFDSSKSLAQGSHHIPCPRTTTCHSELGHGGAESLCFFRQTGLGKEEEVAS